MVLHDLLLKLNRNFKEKKELRVLKKKKVFAGYEILFKMKFFIRKFGKTLKERQMKTIKMCIRFQGDFLRPNGYAEALIGIACFMKAVRIKNQMLRPIKTYME